MNTIFQWHCPCCGHLGVVCNDQYLRCESCQGRSKDIQLGMSWPSLLCAWQADYHALLERLEPVPPCDCSTCSLREAGQGNFVGENDNGNGPQPIQDNVKHPAHYGGDTTYETIKVIHAWNLGFDLGNAVKYISRAGKKQGCSEKEDLEKAIFYIQGHLKRMEEE